MTVTTGHNLIGRRYVLQEPLGSGGMGAVYRATDRLTGQTVALKKVTTLAEVQATPDSDTNDFRIALSDEFRTLASLHHPNIITVLDYGFDVAGQPFFTMELLENARTILNAGVSAPLAEKVRLLLELLQALAYLHRRGILHRDLKPGNILVVDNTVKVLDFGLSLAIARSQTRPQEMVAGTLAYMAPETLLEEQISAASDLYAFGMITYEIFAGRHPFNLKNVGMLVNSILNVAPDFDGIDAQVIPVLKCLLTKKPQNRYPYAETVMAALCEATGQPHPAETLAIRESFLQAAKFVGRRTELERLRGAFEQALAGKGSAWIIGGESGVGKSRLLDELRIRAMVRGALTLRGQAVTEGSMPYQVWREPLRRLALASDLDDREAGIFKSVIPDIDLLLNREIQEAPALDPQANQNRLFAVLLDVLKRQPQTVVMILEDLQWAGSENLALLTQLQRQISELPLLILCSYRDDERLDLPDQLPGLKVLRLNRLSAESIAELSEFMLGSAGKEPHVVNLLARETEGNAFFLVEVVRTLSEMTGELSKVTDSTLPAQIVASGIRDVVQRRLNRVPAQARPLLNLAAIAGRELDLNILQAIQNADDNLNLWLTHCANAAVLEIQEDRWRFTHDKLREGVIAEIDTQTLPQLHLQIAKTIERVYDDDSGQFPALAYHYQQAGIRDKAAHYLIEAANLAKANFANREAIVLYEAAIEQIHLLTSKDDDQTARWNTSLTEVHENLGDVLTLNGQHEAARTAYYDAKRLTPEDAVIRLSRIAQKSGKTWENQRQYDKVLEYYDAAEKVLGERPHSPSQDWWGQWLDVNLHRMYTYYWTANIEGVNAHVQKIGTWVEQYGTPIQRSRFFFNQAAADIRHGRYYYISEGTLTNARNAVQALQDAPDSIDKAFAVFLLGFTLLWRWQLDEAETVLQDALAITERIGDIITQSRILTYLTVTWRKRGSINEVRHYARRSLEVAHHGQMIEYIGMANGNLAWVALREGFVEEAERLALEALEFLQRVPQGQMFPWIAAWQLLYIRLTQYRVDLAVDYARVLLNPAVQPPTDELKNLLESAVQCWANGDTEGANAALHQVCDLARPLGYV